ncbi:scoloptoxin SSD14-like isoform X2 [Tubulanus polymorphus]
MPQFHTQPATTQPATTQPVKCDGSMKSYSKATVVTDADICSSLGVEILKRGGSAVDSAITTDLCLGLANSHSTGLGGGFFMIYYHRASKKFYALDSREVAPQAATEDMYVDNPQDSTLGGKSVAVPGVVSGYWSAHQKFGVLKWEDLFQPIIKLCNEGIPMTEATFLAAQLKLTDINSNPYMKATFINPKTGQLYKIGEKIKRPILAETMKRISKEGAATFYNGSLADDVIADLNEYSSIITKDDLSDYYPKWRTALSVQLDYGLTVNSLPPPSSGAIVGHILSILDGYQYKPGYLTRRVTLNQTERQTLFYHRFIEAMKFGYAARSELGDEDFVPNKQLVNNLTSQSYATFHRNLISDNTTHEPSFYGNQTSKLDQTGTSHFSIVAPNGDAVALTSTINFYFGSKTMGNRTNIIFNNEMDDFSTPNQTNGFGFAPSESNYIEPGKRPMSSMSPTIVTDYNGDVVDTLGASGGSKIISSIVQTLAQTLWLGKSVKESVDSPRLHHQWIPNNVTYEEKFDENIRDRLKELGHEFVKLKGRGAVVQAIHRRLHSHHKLKSYLLDAYSDPRKGGCPRGIN